ncbi:MAG: helix-turn-helix transcriptional regulator [Patescibacteria group bacterium]
MSTIISQLRAYRTMFGLTQTDLADHIGVSRKTIVILEQHACAPNLILAYKLAKFFRCAVEDIFIYKK